MSRSTVVILVLVSFGLGFVAGLGFAAIKGTPPGLSGAPASHVHGPGAEPRPAMQPDTRSDEQLKARLEALNARIKSEPEDVGAYVEAGNLLFDNGRYQQALAYYKEALEIGGEQADILTDMGISFRRMNEPKKAVAMFQRARKADPGHTTSALNLGIVLFHDLKDEQGALKAWKEYLSLNPTGERAEMIRRVVARIEAQADKP